MQTSFNLFLDKLNRETDFFANFYRSLNLCIVTTILRSPFMNILGYLIDEISHFMTTKKVVPHCCFLRSKQKM